MPLAMAATLAVGAAALLPSNAFAASPEQHAVDTTALKVIPIAEMSVPAKLPNDNSGDLNNDKSYTGCFLHGMDLQSRYWTGRCDGYRAGQSAGTMDGAQCRHYSLPGFPYGGSYYEQGRRDGYIRGYSYNYKLAKSNANCFTPPGKIRPNYQL
ncbi:hypothetical protein Snoj_00200 [Streptomyces nojiriensis]|uniref:Uncharacterized protein n=1 Tax=Streptomyces nojiriensis TaxID=66374 RepID=A0ABQ3SDA3_9ACTN|nr:hypothetical protein GCM10010205_81340 [Streptomyces nojiriensis]GHI66102.1 hypothetical protein Snoj_00200 [Streptomyces nojiriensis]